MKKYLLGLLALALVFPTVASAENLTATGTVVSLSGDTLVIDTASGEKTFILSPNVGRDNLAVNSRINVAYADENGKWVVSQITPASSSTTMTSAATRPEPPLESTTPGASTTADYDELPATGSNLPAVLLAGLAALAGAVVLRKIR